MIRVFFLIITLIMSFSVSSYCNGGIWGNPDNNDNNSGMWGNNSIYGSNMFGSPTDNEELPEDYSADNIMFDDPVPVGDGLLVLLFFALSYIVYIVIFRGK